MHWFLLFLLPSAVFGLLAAALPGVGPTPRWRLALRGWRMQTARRIRRDPACDPFEVLRLQTRLAAVAREVRMLTADSDAYGRAHRLQAALAAYDDLLAEACRVAGVPEAPAEAPGASEERRARQRLREEMELSARSWHW
jgi:hypothetical protein